MESIEILNGILTTTFVFITFFVGIKIALKYRDTKDKLYLWMGISWILMVQPYWPAVFAFLLNRGIVLDFLGSNTSDTQRIPSSVSERLSKTPFS